MTYGTLCSGIDAPRLAWDPLGWTQKFSAETDPFCSAVLHHHYPEIPNHGDITKINGTDLPPVDIIIAGTPCQSFSIAGKRTGLDDPRGQLIHDYIRILSQARPTWFIWENVPNALSSGKKQDFKNIVTAFSQLGYSLAWRILDAQHFGVPQQRRRIFLTGHLGNWQNPTKILFERNSLRGNTTPSQKKKTPTANTIGAPTSGNSDPSDYERAGAYIITSRPITTRPGVRHDETSESYIVHTLPGEAHDAGHDGICGRGIPLIYQCHGTNVGPLSTLKSRDSITNGIPFIIIEGAQEGIRRLTPLECERLQGLPDNYTRIPYKNKPPEDCKDAPRYRAIGNSIAVPVLTWIGKRLQNVHNQC